MMMMMMMRRRRIRFRVSGFRTPKSEAATGARPPPGALDPEKCPDWHWEMGAPRMGLVSRGMN